MLPFRHSIKHHNKRILEGRDARYLALAATKSL